MYMTRSMSLAQVRQDFSGVIDEVVDTHERIVVTRHGDPAAMLVAVDDFESMQETLEILSDPELVEDIQQSLKSKKRYTTDEVRARLRAKYDE